MERFPVELLYALAFVGFILFNYFVQKAARRRQQEEEAQAQSAPQAAPAPAPVLAPRPAPLPAPAEPPAPRRRHPMRALLKDKRDLRGAIVLMTVLGPCRAQEPPERTRL